MIRMVRWLCQQGHCVLSAVYDPGKGETFDEVVKQIKEFVTKMKGPKRCSICGSDLMVYEDSETNFKTLEEARPHIVAVQEKHLQLTRFLKATRN